MHGGALLGLVLVSMAWLFFMLGTLLNAGDLLRAWRSAKPASPPLPLLPGVAGSLAAFFSVPALARYGVELAWPWLWILLPLGMEAARVAASLALRAKSKTRGKET